MAEVQTSKLQDALVACLRTNSVMTVGDGEAPDEVAPVGLTHTSYLVVTEVATWRYMGDDYTGQRGSIMEAQFQVTGVGVTRIAATRARDNAVEIAAGWDDLAKDYLYPMPMVDAAGDLDPGSDHAVLRRRAAGVLTVQRGRAVFNAPAYVLLVGSRST